MKHSKVLSAKEIAKALASTPRQCNERTGFAMLHDGMEMSIVAIQGSENLTLESPKIKVQIPNRDADWEPALWETLEYLGAITVKLAGYDSERRLRNEAVGYIHKGDYAAALSTINELKETHAASTQ